MYQNKSRMLKAGLANEIKTIYLFKKKMKRGKKNSQMKIFKSNRIKINFYSPFSFFTLATAFK